MGSSSGTLVSSKASGDAQASPAASPRFLRQFAALTTG
jgi:hypothetical protein